MLRFDEAGEVVWPEGLAETAVEPGEEAEGESNPFLAYVSQSNEMEQHMAVIAAWEERRQGHASGYTADISSLRCEMDRMRSAFKDVVYSYAALLPPGWRIMGDYDKWVKGQACARRNERASKVYNKDMLHDDRQQHAYPGGVR